MFAGEERTLSAPVRFHLSCGPVSAVYVHWTDAELFLRQGERGEEVC